MTKKTHICLICLRTDRKLKVIDRKLAEFHDELCDFTVDAVDPQYCIECEYLLRKLYNFKAKCVMAVKILKNWKRSKTAEKKPLNLLYTLLPTSVLEMWTPNTSKIYSFLHEEDPVAITSVLRLELTSDSNVTSSQVHTAGVPIENIDKSQNLDVIQEIKSSLPDEDIKLEIDSETDLTTINLQELLTLKTEESTTENILFKNNENSRSNEEFSIELNEIVSELDSDLDILNISSDDSKLSSPTKDKAKRKHSPRKRTIAKSDKSVDHNNINCDENKKKKCANNTIVDEDNINVAKKKIVDKDASKRQRRMTKKKISDEDGNKKERFHTKKDIIAELTSTAKSDIENENCQETTSRGRKKLFTKERLKLDLMKKFALCGDLKADDGTMIDKEFIIKSLDDKVTEFVMRQLWNAVFRKSCIKPQALKLFKCIQNKYTNEYESVFDIEYLNTKEKMLEEFDKRKTYENYLNAEYKCEVCYQGFKHEKKLEYHKKCHDESAGDFICSICSVRQKSKKSLISHVNSHEAVYRCKLCPLVTYYRCSMVNHFQWHKGVKFRCETCDATFGSCSAYRSHKSYRHQRRHVCTTCGRAFFTDTGLKWHTTRAHQDEPPSTEGDTSASCDLCQLTFPSEDVYRRHVRITHEPVLKGRRPGSTYSHTSQMLRPRKIPVFTCRVCNAVGRSVGWLSLHFRMEHPSLEMSTVYADKQTHLCEVCGKGYTQIYTLRAHLTTHTGVRAFACGVCPKRFHRALSLTQHRLLHAPPAKSCGFCGKKFRSQSNLSNHMRFHIGDRRYKCKICGKGFLHRSTLNEHVRGVHHNVRRVRKRGVTERARGVALSAEERGD